MHKATSPMRPIAAIAALALLIQLSACSKQSGGEASDRHLVPATGSAPAQTASTASRLGDLSAFRAIAVEVAISVDNGELSRAKARIKDLEVAWDAAEAGLKPKAASDWHVLDKAIDHALDALRTDPPSQPDCKAAMSELLKTFNSLQPSTQG